MVSVETLDKIPFFRHFEPQERELLASISEPHSYEAGTIIFAEGSEARSLCVLVRGLVSFRQKQKGGGTEALMGSVHDPGDVFGIAALLGDQRTHPHTASCLEDTEVIEVAGDKLLALCEERPKVGFHILMRLTAVMADRLAAAREQIRSRIRPGLISHG